MGWTYDEFKKAFLELSTVDLSFYKERQMKRRIDSLLSRNGYTSYEDYFTALTNSSAILDKFMEYITINVSEFYRNPEQWKNLEKQILPDLLDKHGNIRVWSAAASNGEEPYSLAMMLTKYIPIKSIKILATDIDAKVIEKAKAGIYSKKSLENVCQEQMDAFFKQQGDLFAIHDGIRGCVEFQQHDLLREPFCESFHLILCRNVMIYFTEDAKSELYYKFHDALHSDGVLFVGSTEQIIFPQKYNLKPIRTYFYKRTDT